MQINDVLNMLAATTHRHAIDKGWWDEWDRPIPEQIALMHSELSEALEEVRKYEDPKHVYYRELDGKPEGFGVELADCIIRILDTCARYDIKIGDLVIEKVEFNKSREHRHGGKRY